MKTTKSHTVRVIEGDAGGITLRGQEIEDLGEQMIGAAGVLREIGEGATVQTGQSIEKIRDEVGDVHEELKLAGERYRPSGSVLSSYGSKLQVIQDSMRTIVAAAEAAQERLETRRAALTTAQSAVDEQPDAEPDDTAATALTENLEGDVESAGIALGNAEGELDEQFELFDTQWEEWDEAYELALKGIEDATDGNISDGWTDNVAGVVEVVLEVLTWVGVVLTIAALIIGGPIIAAIAAVVGIIALIGAIYLFAKGRMSGGDLAWAIVGALPFGKLGSLFKAGSKLAALKSFGKFAGGPFVDGYDSIRRLSSLRGLRAGAYSTARSGMSARAAQGYADDVASSFGYFSGRGGGVSGAWNRITHGSNAPFSTSVNETIDGFSSHHRGLLTRQLADTPISGLLSTPAPSALTQVLNVGDYAFDRYRQVDARVGDIRGMFADDPVDTWRGQL